MITILIFIDIPVTEAAILESMPPGNRIATKLLAQLLEQSLRAKALLGSERIICGGEFNHSGYWFDTANPEQASQVIVSILGDQLSQVSRIFATDSTTKKVSCLFPTAGDPLHIDNLPVEALTDRLKAIQRAEGVSDLVMKIAKGNPGEPN
jgi:hypothetical protein